MKSMLFSLFGTLAISLPAVASPLFSDNFNAQNGGTPSISSPAFTGWTVTGGSVDLIGSGSGGTSFDVLPGNGLYVDLDGSGGTGAGLFATQMTFAPGTYLVEFSLGGSQRGSTEEVTVSLGNWSETFTRNELDPFIPVSRIITTTGGSLQFQNSNAGGSPNVGALLDNVSVSEAAIPEPATLTLFGGLALAGAAAYRRRKVTA